MFDKSLKFLSIFLHGIRAEALSLQLIVETTVVLSCWAKVIALFFNNLCVGKTLFGCDLQVVGKSEDIVLLLVHFFFFDSRDGCMH